MCEFPTVRCWNGPLQFETRRPQMNHKLEKFEHPIRLAELDPKGTLGRIGFGQGQVLADVGAGTGIFSLPAAEMTEKISYALEISDEMLSILEGKIQSEGVTNLKPVKVTDNQFDIPDHVADLSLLVTSFHEIENPAAILQELGRILKSDGKVAVIEFHNWETPMGPPLDHRISREEVLEKFHAHGFSLQEEFILGENFYCLIFKLSLQNSEVL